MRWDEVRRAKDKSFRHEQEVSRRSADAATVQAMRQNRERWLGSAFEYTEPADLPEGDALVFFATVDAGLAQGCVKAGTFFSPAPGLAFQVSRTFLAASRAAVLKLEALRDELLEVGKTAEAEAMELRPVRPPGGFTAATRMQPRSAETGGER